VTEARRPVKSGRLSVAITQREEVVYLLDPPDPGSRIVFTDPTFRFEICMVREDGNDELLRRSLVRGVEGTGPWPWPSGTEWMQVDGAGHAGSLAAIVRTAECLASEITRATGSMPSPIRLATVLQEAGLLKEVTE
jgi:hypothetical protein